ncbi:Acyl-coenzyme A dehydrogenase [Saliniradius amylolyticus]|uniref:Acyl-coenzyme A dehydrogenase n=1 Tax=Saliniradius amylolyticus TaxID=2183582 RepID=A0A2S2E2J3_9ALTE|nr:acyl-CoA dehydrogenase FadE [Saliniradius amylolyticus]AWL11854.1 Acyl-coenzyme A dehydrogenase [Saliniradius amylolyticus]
MHSLLWLLVIVVALGAAAYWRLKLSATTLLIAAILAAGTLIGGVNQWGWIAFAILALPFNLKAIRKNYLSAPMLAMYRKIMPSMSRTEQEAIDAGTVWWDGELFSGKPNWSSLHNQPKARLTEEEQAFLDGPCEEACRMADEWEINHERADLPPELWQFLKDNKFFAMIIKKEFGGLEFSAYAQSRVLQKLAGSGAVLASTVGVPNSLGPGELLQHYGTEEQKDHYLPRLADGREIPCFALTSPEAGSDAGAIPDTGVVCKGEFNGEEVLGMRLNFSKRYITLAPVATVVGLAFKLYDPDGLLGDQEDLGITCALLPSETKGLEIGRRHFPLNVPFQNGPIKGEDVFVPLDYIIGGKKMAGQGWRMLMECLSVGRCITLPSNSAGGVKSVALATGAYSRIRRQFKLPIGKMEGVEEMLGRIGANAYMMDAVTSMTTKALDMGEKPSVISAICKYHLTERMRQSVIDSMDVHGGKGIILGPNNYIGRAYQGAPIAITVEGANILTRNMMIYGQGAMRCHPFVLRELYAAQSDDANEALSEFDKAVFGHIGFAISNFFRAKWFGFTGGHFIGTPYNDETKAYYQGLERYSTVLAMLSDVAMGVLGGELKRKERVSARLGDILSYLYLGSAVLKRYQDEGRIKEDLPMVHWSMQDLLYRTETAVMDLLDNFPAKGLGKVLKLAVMPFGPRYKKPSDKLDHAIAKILQTPCEARNRLGEGQYLTREEGNPFGQLEQALDDILAAEPLYDKVCKAADKPLPFFYLDQVADKGLELGVLSEQEAELLRRAEQERLTVINVDDFDTEDLVAGRQRTDTSKEKAA